ncbi:hypothetical protein PTKIN_Ptkin11bG0008800 [Pterospermum kingtungense]
MGTVRCCSILAMEQSSFCYKACSNCETTLPDPLPSDYVCNHWKCKGRRYPYKRFFSLLFSIATDDQVLTVICFDKAARVIFGCSADEFFDFATNHPYAAKNASNLLVGEMFRVTLVEPKRSTKAQHLRMTNVVPLRSAFQPVMKSLNELYKVIYGGEDI